MTDHGPAVLHHEPASTGQPLVSVVVPAFAAGWERTVDNLRRRTASGAAVETIVVAGSADPPAARWYGLATAAGDYVTLLDPGDEVLPAWFERLTAVADHTRADIVCWGALRLNADRVVDGIVLPPTSGTHGGRPRLLTAGTFAVRREALPALVNCPRCAALAGAPGRPAPSGQLTVAPVRELLIRKEPVRPPDGAGRHGRRCLMMSGALPVPLPVALLPGGSPPAGTTAPRPLRRPAMVSVILPVRNGADTLAAQIDALAAQTYRGRWEVLVVDNRSSDSTRAVALAAGTRLPGFRLADASARLGEGYARNVGVSAAGGDLLAFCDADDVADPEWLAALVRVASDADQVGGSLDSSVLSPSFLDEQPVPMTAQSDFLPFARSANCAIWKDVLQAVGGWAETYRGGGEDMDLSWRVQLCGYRLSYAPAARMHYRLRSDLGALARQKWRYGRSGARLYRSYRDAGFARRGYRVVLANWLWLLSHAYHLARPGRPRRRWIRYAARLAGFAYGSLQQRVAYF